MPRLSNNDYLNRYKHLRWLWLNHEQIYSYVLPNDQWDIHAYYQPSKDLTDDELIEHRNRISEDRPSLPAKASKAANQLHRISKQRLYAKAVRRTGKHSGPRNITVRSVVNPDIDVKKLARAFWRIAEQQDPNNTASGQG